uniref:RNase III domain-containing protein n=1 Tax=Mycena chlorophos TaxID=658473 RepID=A0ABQ0LMU7_MYCCL|nr:predicted protein [Mycena chlorophos]
MSTAFAHILPSTLFLQSPIEERRRAPTTSTPAEILQQLDNEPGWASLEIPIPDFDSDYPPKFPQIGSEICRKAFVPVERSVLEWLGDAVVEFALIECASTSRPDLPPKRVSPRAMITESTEILQDIVADHVTNNFLGHLALLYGIQLHERNHIHALVLPVMKTVSDVFEALIGAVAMDSGVPTAVKWLHTLFQPWVLGTIEHRKSSAARHGRPTSAPPDIPIPIAPAHELFTCALPGYQDRDLSRVILPPSYPPPLVDDAGTLESAILDGFFIDKQEFVGKTAYKLLITSLAIEQFPFASAAELDDIRWGCFDRMLLARLALLCGLHHRLRPFVPNAREERWLFPPTQIQGALCALAGSQYSSGGWERLVATFRPLITPWIAAVHMGTYDCPAVLAQRNERRRHEEESCKLKRARVEEYVKTRCSHTPKQKTTSPVQHKRKQLVNHSRDYIVKTAIKAAKPPLPPKAASTTNHAQRKLQVRVNKKQISRRHPIPKINLLFDDPVEQAECEAFLQERWDAGEDAREAAQLQQHTQKQDTTRCSRNKHFYQVQPPLSALNPPLPLSSATQARQDVHSSNLDVHQDFPCESIHLLGPLQRAALRL